MDKKLIYKKLDELKAQFATLQNTKAEQTNQLRSTEEQLLRISGAYDVLQEVMNEMLDEPKAKASKEAKD